MLVTVSLMDGTRMDTLGTVAEVRLPSHALLVVSPLMLRTNICTSTTGVVILPVLHVLVVRRHLSGHASAIDPGSPASFAGVSGFCVERLSHSNALCLRGRGPVRRFPS